MLNTWKKNIRTIQNHPKSSKIIQNHPKFGLFIAAACSQVLFWKQEAVEAAAGQADAPDADNDGFRIYSKIGRNYILDVL